jgi:small subunit ribosomal protein S5
MAREIENKDKVQEQLIEKLISVRRVTKVVKGGKNMRFSALVVVGDGKGRVGYASAKAREVPDAVKKASEKAKRLMMRVSLMDGRTIRCDVNAKVGAGHVFLRTAGAGTGVIAGGPMRSIFDALGVKDIVSKSVGSRTYHNVVKATFEALKMTVSPKYIASKLGKKFSDIIERKYVGKSNNRKNNSKELNTGSNEQYSNESLKLNSTEHNDKVSKKETRSNAHNNKMVSKKNAGTGTSKQNNGTKENNKGEK